MQKRTWLWALYDFANSLAYINVSFYFALWFVSDLGARDLWMSLAVATTTVLLLFTLPNVGAWSDRLGRRMPFLIGSSLLAIGSLAALGLIAPNVHELTPGFTFLIILLYGAFQFFYQAALGFYLAFTQELSKGSSAERVSSIGLSAGQLGNVMGLIVMLPIANNLGRPSTFLLAAGLFLLFALPTFLRLKDPKLEVTRGAVGVSLKETLRLRDYPNVLRYLFAFYFFADAILTLQLFFALYFQEVGGFSDSLKTLTGVIGLLFAIVGALLSPRVARRLKSTKRAIELFIVLWTIFLLALSFATSLVSFIAIAALNGVAFGALFTLSRAFYAQITPEAEQGRFFGIYILFERAASILGPLVWSGLAFAFFSWGPDRYRFSMVSLAVMVAISYLIMRTVKERKTA